MSKCTFNVSQANELAQLAIYDYLDTLDFLDLSAIKNLYITAFKSVKDGLELNSKMSSSSEVNNFLKGIKDLIYEIYEDTTGIKLPDSELSISNMRADLKAIIDDKLPDTDNDFESVESLVTPIEKRGTLDATGKFLMDAYGTASTVKSEMILDAKKHLFDACFLDRGLTSMHLDEVTSPEALNRNLRTFQQKLFDDILAYLRTLEDFVPPKETALYTISGNTIVPTEAYKNLETIMKRRLGSEVMNAEILNDIYTSDPVRLKAYNAYVLLNNFDTFLKYVFQDAIRINRPGFKDGSDKYSFADQTANVNKSHRKDDGSNIDINKEAGRITKMLIETTQVIDQNGNPIQGQYLTFNDYAFLTSIFKLNIINAGCKNLVFNPQEVINYDLSKETIDFISGKNFSQVISALRINHTQVMPMIAELYVKGYLDNLKFISELNPEQKNKLYTIMRKMYLKDNDSVYGRVNFLNEGNIYNNLCQTTDSIFKNVLTQCYQSKDGEFYERLMIDLAEYIQIQELKRDINQANASKLIPKDNPQGYLQDEFGLIPFTNSGEVYFIQSIDSKPFNQIYNAVVKKDYTGWSKGDIIIGLKSNYTSSETKLQVGIYDNNQIIYFGLSELTPEQFAKVVSKVKQMSDRLIGTAFINSPVLWSNFTSHSSELQATEKLLNFMNRVMTRMYVSNVLVAGKNYSDTIDYLKTLYKDDFGIIGYDRTHGQVNLDGGKSSSDYNIITELAKARLETLGLTTAAQINNSQGKAQSTNSFSKLYSSYGMQWNLIEKLPISVTQNLDIITSPDLFQGVTITNEFYVENTRQSQSTVSLANSELNAMNVLIDFIPALFETDSTRIHSNGIAHFIAAVASDKNTLAKIGINLNSTFIDPSGTKVSYRDADINQLKYNISKNLGQYYSGMLTKICNDFELLRQFIPKFLDSSFLKSPRVILPTSLDYLHNFDAFKKFVEDLNEVNKDKVGYAAYTPNQFLNNLLTAYNNQPHINNESRISLIENIHISKGLTASNTILAQTFRFGYQENPIKGIGNVTETLTNFFSTQKAIEENPKLSKALKRNWSTLSQFLEMRELELIGSLVSSGTVLNINSLSPVIQQQIRQKYPEWINFNGDLIIAKELISVANGESKYTNIISESSLSQEARKDPRTHFQFKHSSYTGKTNEIILNPILRRQNLLHYLFSQQWMASTVGSFVGHPIKVKNTENSQFLLEKMPWNYELFEESSQFNAQCKRNVSFTAQMNQFQLNTLYGINDTYNIAVIEDIEKFVNVLTSKNNKINPFDGATIVDPFTRYLENNSLAENKSSGETKKTFVHFKNEKVGTGGIIKTAVFALSNDNMRMSPDLNLNLFYKLSEREWKDERGYPIIQNLLESDLKKDVNGNPISIKPEGLYYTKNGKFYYIQDIEYIKGTNNYIRHEIEVDGNGKAIDGTQQEIPFDNVNSNVKAWELFGGLYSMELTDSDGLQFSENSIKAVVTCMNHKGYRIGSGKIETQKQFYQPMKHSQIQYLVTAGAIKQGAANVNVNSKYTDWENLNITSIRMIQAGIQLDKEHHADLSEVSVPTQVIAACAALGISFYDADTLYQGVSAIADIALRQLLTGVQEGITDENYSEFLKLCTETIVKNLATSNIQNFGSFISQSILEAANIGKDKMAFLEAKGLVISDNTIFKRAINILNNSITKNAIKLKMPGTLAIMTPSHQRAQIYGDRKYSDFIDPAREILDTQRKQYDIKPITKAADINPDYEYKLLVRENISIELSPDKQYYNIIYNGVPYSISLKMINEVKNRVTLLDDDKEFNELITIPPEDHPEKESHLKNIALLLAICRKTEKRRPRLRTESIKEYRQRLSSEAYDEFKQLIPGHQIYHSKVTLNETKNNYSEINLWDLRELMERNPEEIGAVSNVTEYIMNGRDLGSYNVRFEGEVSISREQAKQILDKQLSEEYNKPIDPITIKQELLEAEDQYRDQFPLEILIAEYFAYYDPNKQGKINWQTIAKETTGIRKGKDLNREGYKWFTNAKSGRSINEVIHEIYENYGIPRNLSDQDIRNAVIDFLHSNNLATKTDAKRILTNLEVQFLLPLTPSYQAKKESEQYNINSSNVLIKEVFDTEINKIIQSSNKKHNKFSIWDLESVQLTHELEAIKNRTLEQEALYQEAQKQMKRDLAILSKASVDAEAKMNEFLSRITDDNYKQIASEVQNWIALNLGIKESIQVANAEALINLINNYKNTIAGNTIRVKLKSGIHTVKVDRNTITHQDYEVIMPKVFKTIYGLSENVCLAKISNNPNYFVIQGIKKQVSNFKPDQFHIEIKRQNGKHRYIAFEHNFNKAGLTDMTNYVPQIISEDAKTYYSDNEGNQLFEIKDGIKIYQDQLGNEIISINTKVDKDGTEHIDMDNLNYYLSKFSGSFINVSEHSLNLSESLKTDLLTSLANSQHADWIQNNIGSLKTDDTGTQPDINTLEEYIQTQKENVEPLTEEDIIGTWNPTTKKYENSLKDKLNRIKNNTATEQDKLDIKRIQKDAIFRNGRAMYNSFMESLKVIAARIPAQNMQSFMAMKCVAFSNGDKNTAYVSDLQIFLQGSDFRVYSVVNY